MIYGKQDQTWMDRTAKLPGVKVVAMEPGELSELSLNITVKPLDDIRVRQAIAYAIDRKAIVAFKGAGSSREAVSVVPSGYLGTDEKAPLYPYDPAKAKALLTEAGYPNGITIKTIHTTLTGMASRFPHEFSGGQRQRLCIARALALQPRLLVADEAVSALDVSIKAQVINLMMDLQAEMGLAYLFISHDIAVVERVSHRVAVMYLGEIVEIGPRAAIIENPQHPYTKRLMAAVPVPEAGRRALRRGLSTTEVPSPVRRVGDLPATPPLVEVAPLHFVQPSE